MPFSYLITSGREWSEPLLQHNNVETFGSTESCYQINRYLLWYGAGYFSIPTRFDLYHFVITLR